MNDWQLSFLTLGRQVQALARFGRQAGLAACLSASGLAWAGTPPAHWQEYARQASDVLHEHILQLDQPAAHRLAEWARLRPGRAIGPLRASLWIDARGRVPRLELDSLGDAGADELVRVLVGQVQFGQAPPLDMPQPLRLRLYWEYPSES